MAAEFICPHCESTIPDSEQRAESLTTCPYCNAALSPSTGPMPPAPAISPSAPPGPIRFSLTCERCGSILEANSAHAGRTARCPTCGATFIVPSPDPHTGLPTGRAVEASDGQPPTPMHAYAAAGNRAPRIDHGTDGVASIICPRCDARNSIDADLCRACGTPFTIEGARESAASPSQVSTAAILSFTLGLLVCVPVGPLAILAGVIALFRARHRPGRQRTRAVAWIGIGLGVACTLGWLAYWT